MIEEEKKLLDISIWKVVFSNWSEILPLGNKIIEGIQKLTKIIDTYELKTLNQNQQMDIEISASEELVKIFAWENSVNDVCEFVIGTHNSEDIILMAGKLNQRFKSINSSYAMVQKHFTQSKTNEKSFKMFSTIGKKILPPSQLRDKLLKQMKKYMEILNYKSYKRIEKRITGEIYQYSFKLLLKI